MTTEEYEELKEELSEVLRKIEVLKSELNILYREKKRLKDMITGHEGKPLNTTIEYLFSRFDDERSNEEGLCAKATVTKAKKLLLNSEYTDLKQLEGKKFTDFFGLCEGTKVLAVILAYCIKCDVKMDMGSTSRQDEDRIQGIKYEAIWYTEFIVF